MKLLANREATYLRLAEGLRVLAAKHGLRLMNTPENPISLALSLRDLHDNSRDLNSATEVLDVTQLTQLGAKLFTQGCSGVRLVEYVRNFV